MSFVWLSLESMHTNNEDDDKNKCGEMNCFFGGLNGYFGGNNHLSVGARGIEAECGLCVEMDALTPLTVEESLEVDLTLQKLVKQSPV